MKVLERNDLAILAADGAVYVRIEPSLWTALVETEVLYLYSLGAAPVGMSVDVLMAAAVSGALKAYLRLLKDALTNLEGSCGR